jgi:hypothetical protein
MTVRPPLFLDNRGDHLVFESVEAAQGYLEAIDVENGEYVGYDSEGRALSLSTTGNRVVVGAAEAQPEHAPELRQLLVDFSRALGVSEESLLHASLEELVWWGRRYSLA